MSKTNEHQRWRWGQVLLILLLLSGSLVVLAGELGDDFFLGAGRAPAIDTSSLGEVMVVWEDPDGGIQGQAVNSMGEASSEVFDVSLGANGALPSVTWTSDDDVAVTWERRDDSLGGDSRSVAISQFRRAIGSELKFDGKRAIGSEFRAIGSEFRISKALFPAVVSNGDGEYIVTWTGTNSGKRMARYFDDDGRPSSSNLRLGSSGAETPSSIAMLPTGETLVVWDEVARRRIKGRLLVGGRAIGSQFRINTPGLDNSDSPSVTANMAGDFTVVWQRYNRDGSSDIVGRIIDVFGRAIGSQFAITGDSSLKNGDVNFAPQVAADGAGNQVVVWRRNDHSVMARPLSLDGRAIGSELRVDLGGVIPGNARITETLGGHDFVVLWDDDEDEILGRFLTAPFDE